MEKKKKRAYLQKNCITIYLAENRRLLGFSSMWGIPFSLSCVLGWRLVHRGTVFCQGGSAAAHAASFLLFWLTAAVLSLLTGGLAAFALYGMKKLRTKRCGAGNGAERQDRPHEKRQDQRKVWLFYTTVIFLCWLPVFLAYYPSVFAYDAEGQ
ncbi:MAG: hypothetical protein NC489_39655, partial [Ruminococcus flavefaciens]|nr:hypothetical protein [Ruminococcus flavefaciens]